MNETCFYKANRNIWNGSASTPISVSESGLETGGPARPLLIAIFLSPVVRFFGRSARSVKVGSY